MPPGTRLDSAVAKGDEISTFLREQPGVDYTYTTVGGGFRGGSSNGQIFVKLVDKDQRPKQGEIENTLREKLREIPAVRPQITGARSIFGGRGLPIVVNVHGPEASRLKIAANEVLGVMRDVPGVVEPHPSDAGNVPQLDVRAERNQ